MKFLRFEANNESKTGVFEEAIIKVIQGDILGQWDYTGDTFDQNEVKVLAPHKPNQIIGIGANFVSKRSELPEKGPVMPVFFFKLPVL